MMPLTHYTPTRTRRGLSVLLRALALLSLAALLGACGAQSSFVRAAPVPASAVVVYTAEGKADSQNRPSTELVGVRGRDGKELWRTPIGRESAFNASLIAGDTVYADGETRPQATAPDQTPTDAIVAVRLHDGKFLWRTRFPAAAVTFTVDTTTVAVSTGDDLYALGTADGLVRWHQPLLRNAAHNGGLRMAGGVVLIQQDKSFDESNIIWAAFREGDGVPVWQMALPQFEANHTALFGTLIDYTVRAWSLQTGQVAWEHQFTQPQGVEVSARGVLAANDSAVLVQTAVGVDALDAASGAELWQAPATMDAQSMILRTGADAAYFVTNSAMITATRIRDGAQLWRATVADNTVVGVSAIVSVGSALFAMINERPPHCLAFCAYPNNRVVALNAMSGAVAWWRDYPDAWSLMRAP
jgi:outer membrane protein assembly factor BamB